MGQDSSVPILNSDKKELDLEKIQGVLPWRIPEDHVLEKILVSKSTLNTFPTKLAHLTELVLLACCYGIPKEEFEKCDFDFPSLKVLNLKGCTLEFLPKSLLQSHELEKVDLSMNRLTEDLTMDTPHLNRLTCDRNKMRNLPKGLSDSLVKLNFSFNRLEELDLRLSKLEFLNLAGNNIFFVSPNCYFPSLIEMDVSYNMICSLDGLGKIAPQLKKLNCSWNMMFQFPAQLPRTIEEVDASNNRIVEFAEPLVQYTALRIVDVTKNMISVYPSLPPSVEEFHTHRNCIERFEPLNSTKMKVIDLTGSSMTVLPNPGHAKINSLFIDGNKITSISDIGRFSHLVNLRMSRNLLKSLDSKIGTLVHLQNLRLCGNMVTSLPDCLSNMPLAKLYVAQNPIKTLPVLPRTLEILNCFGCEIETLQPRVFERCTSLQIVDLSANKLTKLDFIPKSERVILALNKLTRVPEIDPAVKCVDFAHNELSEFVMYDHLVMVDVSHNQITTLTFSEKGCPALEELKLSYNRELEFNIDFHLFPALLRGDLSGTKIKHPLPIPPTVDEFITASLEVMRAKKQNSVKFFSSGVGYSSTIGRKAHMEDSMIVFRSSVPERWSFYGMLDGHGGRQTAIQGSSLLQMVLMRELKEIDDVVGLIARTDKHMWKKNIGHDDGACVLLAMIRGRELGIANLGDCRAVLVKKNCRARQITTDHKASDRGEIERAKESGAFLRGGRLEGLIATTRTIGDYNIHSINKTPDVFKLTLADDDFRLVIACDGMYDVLTNEDVAQIVTSEPDVYKAATLLRQAAVAYGSCDNISALVIDIQAHVTPV